jgi:hypothetical protein
MGEQLTIPLNVQRHIMTQLMCGNDVEIRLADGELRVIALRKKSTSFPYREQPSANVREIRRHK